MELKYYVLRRVILQVIVIIGVMTITFFVYKSIPGDPIAVLLGPEGMRDKNLVRLMKETWKLDEPVWVQWAYYMKNFLQGNFGRSLFTGRDVLSDLAYRFPATVELVIFGFLIAMAIGIPAGLAPEDLVIFIQLPPSLQALLL